MAGKKESYYFEAFEKLVSYSYTAAEYLRNTFENFDVNKLSANMDYIHQVERGADVEKHKMTKRLMKEFITPIEREDIMQLAHELDEITDNIEDVLLRVYMFHIQKIRLEAKKFSTIIESCCANLKKTMAELHNFRKSSKILEYVIEINRLEEEGDRLYVEAMRTLYATSRDPLEIIIWSETFNCLEACCDACEHAADAVEGIILKNS